MTRRDTRRKRWLQDRAIRAVLSGVVTVGVLSALVVMPTAVLAGCKKKKPPPPPPPPPPPAPVVPDPIQIDPLLQSMKPDARVQYPQARSPVDESLARAVISLCDAMAKGDSEKLSALLAPGAKSDLDALVNSGDWEDSTKRIEAIRVVFSTEMPGDALPSQGGQVVLAFQEPGGAYIVGFNALNNSGTWVFDGMGTTPGKKARATEWEGLTLDDLTRATALASSNAAASVPNGLPADETAVLKQYFAWEVGEKIAVASGADPRAAAMAAGLDPASADALKVAGKAIVDKGVSLPAADLVAAIDTMKLAAAALGNKVTEDQIFGFAAEVLKGDAVKLKDEYTKAKSGGGDGGAGGGGG